VPTPHGFVHVSVEAGSVTLSSPVPVVFVHADGAEEALPAGSHALAL
jgi:hypothetical protein